MKKAIFLLLLPLLFFSCKRNTVSIIGSLMEFPTQVIYLEEFEDPEYIPVDSVRSASNGEFKFRTEVDEAQFLRLRTEDDQTIMLLVEPGEQILLKASGNNLTQGCEISGSAASEKIYLLEAMIARTRYKLDSIRTLYREYSEANNTRSMSDLEVQFDSIFNIQRKFSINQIIKDPGSLANILLLYQKIDEETYVLYKNTDLQYMKIVRDSLLVNFPESKYAQALQNDFQYQMGNYRNQQFQSLLERMEDTDLDIKLPDPTGDTIQLSSMRGQYVLLGFWASWNEESIENNREIQRFYNRYHPMGFQVYQVSLDTSLVEWEGAIAYENIPWTQVSELSFPDSKVDKVFNISALPSNYLLDPEGRIIAKNLFGIELRVKLSQIYD
jgi:peroxiredoxin